MSIQDLLTRTSRALEWDRLKLLLSEQAHTSAGKELCLSLTAAEALIVAELLLQETQEAASLVETKSGFNFESLPDVKETLERLKAGGMLAGIELAGIKKVLVATRMTRSSLSLLEKQSFPQLTKFIEHLFIADSLVQAINQAVEDDGEIKDTASPLLNQLRRQVHALDSQIRDELTKIIHSSAQSKALQEPLYTQRNGRYVLPVAANMRTAIDGIVHDSSASGLTVYVEPLSVVELENKLRIKQAEIEREIVRILTELTAEVREKADDIVSSFDTLIQLDFIMARARLGLKYNGTCPTIRKDGKLKFIAARHPLMVLQRAGNSSSVIPNDISLSPDAKSLIITGPNTGGKTVYLKTIGLLCLMIKSGLMLPVTQGSEALYFTEIFADIGDEQSIEQNLSTFSSHMRNIIEIVEHSTGGNLVLLDEIGAGTDPREGAALARAILEQLHTSGAYAICSTHYGELKTLAYAQKGFVNASLEFDEANLSPTYRIRIGVPGASKATTMARRLGLSPSVADAAESYLKESERDLQKTIEQLESKLKDLAVLQEQAELANQKAIHKENEALDLLKEAEHEKEKLNNQYKIQLEDEFQLTKDNLRTLIADLQKQPSSQKAQQAQKQIEELRHDLKWFQEPKSGKTSGLEVGQRVRVLSLNQVGVVVDAPPEGSKAETVTVKIGHFQVKVSSSDLRVEAGAAVSAKGTKSKQSSKSKAPDLSQSSRVNVFVQTQSNTVDLRGERVLEAIDRLERFLDQCTVSNQGPLLVIHGHGTGAVKAAVRDYLSTSSYVFSFRPGETYEGGDGVTVVELT